ncbi:MAG: uncharacterized protein KVP18_000186 [Porospora cf. gigantea A]|uniref:uncharacterized protein n=1 Tax=Porospora cf. gigantea A TaxID=2853593 RepID=UPI00355A8834|nr:MAG: hypothetical protein KVP18_000186 [Porospora cf. gigantea A]
MDGVVFPYSKRSRKEMCGYLLRMYGDVPGAGLETRRINKEGLDMIMRLCSGRSRCVVTDAISGIISFKWVLWCCDIRRLGCGNSGTVYRVLLKGGKVQIWKLQASKFDFSLRELHAHHMLTRCVSVYPRTFPAISTGLTIPFHTVLLTGSDRHG